MRQINAFERGKVLIECQSVAAGGGGAQGWAALRAADGRSTWASPRQGPAIWSPSGRPSRVNPQGTVIAGTPHDGEALGRQQPSVGKGGSTAKGGIAGVGAMTRSHRAENPPTRCQSAVRSRSQRPRHRRGPAAVPAASLPRVESADVSRSPDESNTIVSA